MTTPATGPDGRGELHLALLIGGDFGAGGWRRPGSRVEELYGLGLYQELARIAEDARFDAIFRADGLHLAGDIRVRPFARPDSIVQLSALAATTSHIGLVVTASTSFTEPYGLARQLATLDHISNGRVGWNIVTSKGGEQNFGKTFSYGDQQDRYRRADEHVRVAKSLWTSWDEDAIVIDRSPGGLYADRDRIRPIDHDGDHFAVAGPLVVPRSPQTYPVLAQAGASDSGKDFAARHAELVFVAATDLRATIDYADDLEVRLGQYGRSRHDIRILPGIKPILGSTEAEARQRYQELAEITDWDSALRQVGHELGQVDLSGLRRDLPIPAERFTVGVSELFYRQSRPELLRRFALQDGHTLEDVVRAVLLGAGHYAFVGTPEQLADELERWWRSGAADGFNIIPPDIASVAGFAETVVPLLQQRGIFRRDYTATTLRGHLGLRLDADRGDRE
ncbi:NtaA/DmoA family FMN-dependent monooxygenase [Sphaerisporangium sp. NPDC051017]|uniref:NtaA/DmoA family FMN-dependent monooxygenase n=1 Tax=Sphaerisporangium sp. NPDC051017 TaxID=3154636 RepID=UPI003448B6FE